jgi:hypothetical protein
MSRQQKLEDQVAAILYFREQQRADAVKGCCLSIAVSCLFWGLVIFAVCWFW